MAVARVLYATLVKMLKVSIKFSSANALVNTLLCLLLHQTAKLGNSDRREDASFGLLGGLEQADGDMHLCHRLPVNTDICEAGLADNHVVWVATAISRRFLTWARFE